MAISEIIVPPISEHVVPVVSGIIVSFYLGNYPTVSAAILPCSQYTYVQATGSQKREYLVRTITDCKSWLGGLTKAIVGDYMSAVVARGHKYAPVINKTRHSEEVPRKKYQIKDYKSTISG